MDRLKLSQFGERLKIGGAQMSRLVSDKVKEILQTSTPESKIVDEATLETMEDPNWGLNLRICAMINGEQFSGAEIVRAIKKKISGKSVVSQRLSLDLLEACAMNCEKVFSEVASERVLDEMVKMIDNPQTDIGNRTRAIQLIRAWGETEDLEYLPIFRQTYMSLKERSISAPRDGMLLPTQYSSESYIQQLPLSPPESHNVTDSELNGAEYPANLYNHGSVSVEKRNEFLLTTRNSLELLSSILNSETEPKPIKEDLTVSLLEKCKQSQPVIKRVIESTMGDEAMLFDALNLNDELQKVISLYEELEADLKSGDRCPESSDNTQTSLNDGTEKCNETNVGSSQKDGSSKSIGSNT
ncbi:hypothetical protein K2173_018483 [Erythroxylum novogranatense]|uniref:TOM1-like protein 2 n=1 Tax=Erythroxylum novogranatense TaxID=1862640 RepID=A0AAV8UAK5_9ROSI|nr:hypothetical protein K2173_018483 [Erythroxylum novogranatense]